jgi:phosphinothricin acetyltransferase
MVTFRPARRNDIGEITEIYNEAILTTVATFDTEIKTLEEQEQWFDDHGVNNPILVAEHDGRCVGWASLSKWSDRCAYSDTAEISVYVRAGWRGKGIGRGLLEAIIAEGAKTRLHTIIARITQGNASSIHLHKSVGFITIGTMKEVSMKFGKRLDVHLMQKIYTDH